MPRINPADWEPQGVESLEPIALNVVREVDHNALVTAGPGAGKTELLAQRATYLLQTGLCPYPKRILAISFKRDAAKNLKDRVELRCGKELASRFDSFTFDAFAKSILDRFKNALPEIWRPSEDYEIDFDINKAAPMSNFLDQLDITPFERQQLHHQSFEKRHLTGNILPVEGLTEETLEKQVAKKLWRYFLHEQQSSRLSFTMIGRLSELILRTNSKLLLALRNSYSFVFLDEFQDVTDIQYELTKTCFQNSSAKVTAVGDNKQRIMGWARALDGVFNHFAADFKAQHFTLIRNYRSAPRLVEIQHAITQTLEGQNAIRVESMDESEGEGECRVLIFENSALEASNIADLINSYISNDNVKPRDICLLTRQTPERYTTTIMSELLQRGIASRVENELQDILVEPLTQLVIDMLKLITQSKSTAQWSRMMDFLIGIHGEDQADILVKETGEFLAEMKANLSNNRFASENDLSVFLTRIVDFIGTDILMTEFRQYRQGNYFNDTLQKIATFLFKYYIDSANNLSNALVALEGENSIPIMTMHKSKGLEFHTVIFIGLEDNALWGYNNNATEETNGFFVAFSRAKKRIVFTASINREIDGENIRQSSRTIAPLYEILRSSGITPDRING